MFSSIVERCYVVGGPCDAMSCHPIGGFGIISSRAKEFWCTIACQVAALAPAPFSPTHLYSDRMGRCCSRKDLETLVLWVDFPNKTQGWTVLPWELIQRLEQTVVLCCRCSSMNTSPSSAICKYCVVGCCRCRRGLVEVRLCAEVSCCVIFLSCGGWLMFLLSSLIVAGFVSLQKNIMQR